MEDELLSLVRANVTKVLGEYDHSLDFSAADDFAILYGPNGVGKTRFLEIIHYLSRMESSKLARMPFEVATLDYSDGSSLRARLVRPSADNGLDDALIRQDVEFALKVPKHPEATWSYRGDDFEDWLVDNTPWRKLDELGTWEDQRDGEIARLVDLTHRYPEAGKRTKTKLPAQFQQFLSRTNSYLIETQRLRIEAANSNRGLHWRIHGRKPKQSSKIAEHASKMRSLVNDAQTKHSTITQQLDRTFPNRVLSESNAHRGADDIRARYEEQNGFRSRLGRVVSVPLADALSLPPRDLQEWELRLLNLYLDDADKKLEPFENLMLKIELLEDIVNSRLLNKNLVVTAEEGLKVLHASDQRSIDLESLSSGEQHEIILMFDLLFNVPYGALVLIDEPEISLHVVWQLAFIPDVSRIAEAAGFRFVVATHSPQIINDAWERSVRLGPPEVAFS